jgi:transposase
VKSKKYVQWIVILPPENIEALGWKKGESLRTIVKPEGLLIAKGSEYDIFREQVIELLRNNKTGLTWTEIQKRLGLSQTVPNNRWVRQLEKETGLQRRKEGTNTYWFLPDAGVVVYTIGYEGKTPETLLAILKKHGIQQLVDVREIALSRKNGYAKSELSRFLRSNGIIYKHYPALGSPSEIRHKLWKEGDYEKFFKEYSQALNRDESQEYLTDLEGLAHMRRTVLMCFEHDVEKCHRKIIKKRLIRDGFKVADL